MAIRTSSKINAGFSLASMSDLVFLLLIFFMVTSTMVAPNALKLLLPQSNSQVRAKPITTISIDKNLTFFLETQPVKFEDLERALQMKLMNSDDPTVSLHADKSVPVEEVVKVMNIAKNNKYKLILATSPES